MRNLTSPSVNKLNHPHGSSKFGYWSPVTSTLDWCEENYRNSITNLAFLLYGMIGLWSCVKTRSEIRFYLCYISYMVVGLGSFLFHSTLNYEMQLLDELPMIWGTAIFSYCLLQTFPQSKKEQNYDSLHKTFFVSYALIVTLVYLMINEPIFHHTAFGLLIIFSAVMPWFYFNRISNMSGKNASIIKKIKLVFALSSFAFIFGFTCWNIDQLVCGNLRTWRDSVGYPLRIVAEFHAWWHLFAGYGTYVQLVTGHYVRFLATKTKNVKLVYYGLIPVIQLDEKIKVV